jgi:hypothetical protein
VGRRGRVPARNSTVAVRRILRHRKAGHLQRRPNCGQSRRARPAVPLLAASALDDLEALRLFSGDAILSGLTPEALRSLARSALWGHGNTYSVGLIFSGLRGTAFGVLWFRSGLIPKPLAVWADRGFGAARWTFAFIPFPELHGHLGVVIFGVPILLFELTMGIWLVLTSGRFNRS